MKVFVWCRASPNDRRGYKDSVAHAYSESVRRQLYGIPVPDPLNAPVSEWVAACKEYEDQILGVLLCEFSCSPDFMTLLSPHQREIRSYWCATDFSEDPLCFVKVVDFCTMLNATAHAHAGERRRGMFYKMSAHSRMRLEATNDADAGRPVREIIANWVCEHNGGVPFLFDDVVFSVVTPHAMLLTVGEWNEYCFPFPSNRFVRGRIGIPYLSGLFDEDAIVGDVPDDVFGLCLSLCDPSAVLQVADALRRCYTLSVVGGSDREAIEKEAKQLIAQLARLHHGMALEHATRSKNFVSAEYLIQCLMFAGCLKQYDDLVHALVLSVRLTNPYANQREHLLRMLQEEHKPPSASVCNRNRFMFTMGFYRYMAIASARLLALGPVISWATMDASPQQGWDWFMHGRLRISARNLIEYFRKAVRYICVCRQLADDEDDLSSNQHVLAEEVKFILFLQDVLRLQMGVPGCTGAGRSGVRHQLHAWVHSE